MKTKKFYAKAASVLLAAAMILIQLAGVNPTAFAAEGDSFNVLFAESFEGETIPGTPTNESDMKLVSSNDFSESYSNTEFGFDKMLEMNDSARKSSPRDGKAVAYARGFDAVTTGTANAYMEFEFDLGIVQKGLSEFHFQFTSDGVNKGYLRWNSQSGALNVHPSSGNATNVCNSALKASSATAENKLDHIKFAVQVTDEAGNVVNKFKSFSINGGTPQSKDIDLGNSDAINGIKIVMNSPSAGWHNNPSAQNAQVHIDNLVATRYISADGKSSAPDRYAFYNRARETFSKIADALKNGLISASEAETFRSEALSAANVYKTGTQTEEFTSAEAALAAVEAKLKGGFETLYHNNFESDGEECAEYAALIGYGKMKRIERAAKNNDPGAVTYSFTNAAAANDTVQIDVDLGTYNVEGLANVYIYLKNGSANLGYFTWNPGAGAFSYNVGNNTKKIVGEAYAAATERPNHFVLKFTKTVSGENISYVLNEVRFDNQKNAVKEPPAISGEINGVSVGTKRKGSVDYAYGMALDNLLITSYAMSADGKSPVADYYEYRNGITKYSEVLGNLGASENEVLNTAKNLCSMAIGLTRANSSLAELKDETGRVLADSLEWSAVSTADKNALAENITLPTVCTLGGKNFDLVWKTSNSSVISATGAVNRGKLNKTAVLTATGTIDADSLKFEKSFDVRVLAKGNLAAGGVSGQVLAAAQITMTASGEISVKADSAEIVKITLEQGVSDVQFFADTEKDKYILFVNGAKAQEGNFEANSVTNVVFDGGTAANEVLLELDKAAYEVVGLSFKDANGNARTIPTAGGKLTGVILADKNIFDDAAVVIAALYDGNKKLIAAKHCQAPAAELDATVEAPVELSLPSDESVLEGTEIRIFVFNNPDDIKPMSDLFIYSVGENLPQNAAIHIAGDSTAERYGDDYYPRAGWGQVFGENFMTAQL